VLEREPAWDTLPPATPQRVRDLLQRCLRKDVRRRARDAGDIAIEIEEALASPASPAPAGLALERQRSLWVRAVPFLMAAIAIAAALAGRYIQRGPGPSPPASMTRLTALLPPNDRFSTGLCPDVAVSPDGKLVAYIGFRGGRSQLFLRAMDSSEATAVPGTEGVTDTVFFSPDGLWLGYLQGNPNVLRKIPISGGSPVTLANTRGCGADWGPEDQIFVGRIDGIFQIPAGGGTPKSLIPRDLSKGERGLGVPQLLPGGKAMLFTVRSDQGFQIVAQRLASGERHILVKGDDRSQTGGSGRYAPPGFLVYSQADTLMAAPFSVDRLELTGPSVPIARGGGQIGSQFSLSRSAETLVYVQSEPAPLSTLVWVDRKGVEEPMGAAPGRYSGPRLSPAGHKVALAADSDMWVYDLARRTLTRVTFGGDNRSPVWTPDGARITYTKDGAISWSLADGSSHEERLWSDKFGIPTSWSPDGKRLLFLEAGLDNHVNVSVLSVEDERKATPVVQSQFLQGDAVFSPDGRRFAYSSNESGRPEVYVQEFPGPGGKVQVSSQGGSAPVWARKSRELFYLSGDKMMAVDITAAPVFEAATPRVLFEGRYNRPALRNFDVTEDGQRFVMVKSGGTAPPVTQLNVVLNWHGDVMRKALAK
jgi:Tol biopolymer transport system component